MPADRSIVGTYKIARELERLIELRDHRQGFKRYRKCFTGTAAVRAMLSSGICETLEDAIETGEQLIKTGYIQPAGEGEEAVFKDDHSFYTFVTEKRMTRQEKESSIHRIAVSLTGGYQLNIEGELFMNLKEHSLKGLELPKGNLYRSKKRYVQLSGGYMTIYDNNEIQRLIPLSTVVGMEYVEFRSTDFSFVCVEDDIESTYFFRNDGSADLWVRHLVIEVLNAAQVIENSITLVLRDSNGDKLIPEKFEELLRRAVILWGVLDFPCKRQGVAVSASEALKRFKAWINLTEANGQASEPLNETVTDEQVEQTKTIMDELNEEEHGTISEVPVETAQPIKTAPDYTALDEIREHSEELLYKLINSSMERENLVEKLQKEMEMASLESQDESRYKNGLPDKFEFKAKHLQRKTKVKSGGRWSRGTTKSKGKKSVRASKEFGRQSSRLSRAIAKARESTSSQRKSTDTHTSMSVEEFQLYFKEAVSMKTAKTA